MGKERKDQGGAGRRGVSRREFSAMSVAVGLTAGLPRVSAAAQDDVVGSEVTITTPDGACDAYLVHPRGRGPWPAVIVFPDIFGLRPAMRELGGRLAANGYTVLVPNPFYRATTAPGILPGFDFDNAQDRARLAALRAPLTSEGVARDARAYLTHLDSLRFVRRNVPAGVVGYCMGGPMTLQAAAGVPERIGAGASFHGGGLVTDRPDSPHLLVTALRAAFYFGIAAKDDERQPQAKTALAQAFAGAHRDAKIEVYPGTLHGWCVKDMPTEGGWPIYDEAAAERAWGELLALYRRALA